MKGRKPTPEHLKIMRGNPGRRPLNPDAPAPDPDIPDAPAHLSEPAAAEWDRISVELMDLGLLSQIDMAALTIYCTAWGRHVEAETHLRVEGLMLMGKAKPIPTGEKDDDGNPILEEGKPYQNPWVGVSNRAIELMQSMLAEFGLSPSSRSRLTVTPKVKKKESLFG
jgi:P27 family predicted phage terminase small subunit